MIEIDPWHLVEPNNVTVQFLNLSFLTLVALSWFAFCVWKTTTEEKVMHATLFVIPAVIFLRRGKACGIPFKATNSHTWSSTQFRSVWKKDFLTDYSFVVFVFNLTECAWCLFFRHPESKTQGATTQCPPPSCSSGATLKITYRI